jgi:hypothetical protein
MESGKSPHCGGKEFEKNFWLDMQKCFLESKLAKKKPFSEFKLS